MPAGAEAVKDGFRFIRKEYSVFRFHPFAGGAVEASVDFQPGIATQGDFAGAEEGEKPPAPGKAGAAQVCMPDHLASCKGIPNVMRWPECTVLTPCRICTL